MKKYDAYRASIFTITTAIVFFIWSIIQPTLVSLTGINQLASLLLGALISLGAYRLVLGAIEKLVLKFEYIKKLVFGSSYLNGVWVGVYIGMNGKPRYYIEYFEQDFNSLIIRSKCYSDDLTYKGDWKSTNVSVNEDKGELYYTYETTMQNNNYKNIGFAIFNFERATKDVFPTKLHGFSSDIYSNAKLRSVEEKIPNPKGLTEEKMLNMAIEVYESNKSTLLHVEM